MQGYYTFSQKLKHVVRLPFAISAYGILPTIRFSFVSTTIFCDYLWYGKGLNAFWLVSLFVDMFKNRVETLTVTKFVPWLNFTLFRVILWPFDILSWLIWHLQYISRDRCNASCDSMEAPNPHSFYFCFATVSSSLFALWVS